MLQLPEVLYEYEFPETYQRS